MRDIIIILFLQLIYVPIFTLRTIFLVKNRVLIASFLGFIEALIYVFGLSIIFRGEMSPIALVVYAVGFGAGMLIGGAIENKLAIGYNNLVVNLINKNMELVNLLRDEGFGVTIFEGEGRDGMRYRLDILAKRCREKELLDIIENHEPKAFIISYETRRFKGGYLVKGMKKSKKNKKNKCS